MRYLLALVVIVGTLAALVWTGIDISPTPQRHVEAISQADSVAAAGITATPSTDTPSAPSPAPAASPPPLPLTPVSGLLVPVQGVPNAALVDTFTDARSEGRLHDAIDIMAPAGTPVVAVADGHIEKLFTSDRGGLTIYQFDSSTTRAYYYAHLERYAAGLAEKQTITRGQVLGYVGSTGNASADAPHLHFAIFVLGPERQWWKGTAINPYPELTSATK